MLIMVCDRCGKKRHPTEERWQELFVKQVVVGRLDEEVSEDETMHLCEACWDKIWE